MVKINKIKIKKLISRKISKKQIIVLIVLFTLLLFVTFFSILSILNNTPKPVNYEELSNFQSKQNKFHTCFNKDGTTFLTTENCSIYNNDERNRDETEDEAYKPSFDSKVFHKSYYNEELVRNEAEEIIIEVPKEIFGEDRLTLYPIYTDSGVLNCNSKNRGGSGNFNLCITSSDFSFGGHGYFETNSGFYKENENFYSGLFSAMYYKIQKDAVTELTNPNGLDLIKIIHVENEDFPENVIGKNGTPGRDIGAIINLNNSEFSSLSLSMNYDEQYTSELFDKIINNIRIDESKSEWKSKVINSSFYKNFKIFYPRNWTYNNDNNAITLKKDSTKISIIQGKFEFKQCNSRDELSTLGKLSFHYSAEKSNNDPDFEYYHFCKLGINSTDIGNITIKIKKGDIESINEAYKLMNKIIIYDNI